ncbi:MAG: GNAT family protein [Actinomycetota bacterium]|nr:GNAT family protein [Actinomycetota bacterium]
MEPLPSTIRTRRLVLRSWVPDDAPALAAAVVASLDHLRPWLPWAADEPITIEARRGLLASFAQDRDVGGDATYGVFLDGGLDGDAVAGGEAIGGCGLHHRRGPGTLEIGYWLHVDHTGRGYATELAAALTTAAFAHDGIETVEIHHDRANTASRAVPERLGFNFAGERPDEPAAPAQEGIDCTWTMSRHAWSRLRSVSLPDDPVHLAD